MITVAYITLFASKYVLTKQNKINNRQKNQKVRFKRAIKELDDANMLMSMTKIEINGKYFYESSCHRSGSRGVLFNELNSMVLNNSGYAQSPLGQLQLFIRNSYDDITRPVKKLLSNLPIDEIEEDSAEWADVPRARIEPRNQVKTTESESFSSVNGDRELP